MRIAVLGSVALPVPPPAQGGTEWIAYYQAKGLAELGHQVTLFAAHGSLPGPYRLIEVGKGNTVAGSHLNKNDLSTIESSRNLRLENIYLATVLDLLFQHKSEYDLILNNMRGETVFLPYLKFLQKPFVSVMHLPIFDELAEIFKKFNLPLITISYAQQKSYPDLNYLATVYNGVDLEKLTFSAEHEDFLLMMGSIARHKNQLSAIRVAKKLKRKLVLAGKIGSKEYFAELKKEIDSKQIVWVGELDFARKLYLFQNAAAFIFPVLWEEPFGLVMIEAMACGAPVVAFGNGAIPEVVVDGKTGFVIEGNSEEKMAAAIEKIGEIKREDCRKHVEENFTIDIMVKNYESALNKIFIK